MEDMAFERFFNKAKREKDFHEIYKHLDSRLKDAFEMFMSSLIQKINLTVDSNYIVDDFDKMLYILRVIDYYEDNIDFTAKLYYSLEEIKTVFEKDKENKEIYNEVLFILEEEANYYLNKDKTNSVRDFVTFILFEKKNITYVKHIFKTNRELLDIYVNGNNVLEETVIRYINEIKKQGEKNTSYANYYEDLIKLFVSIDDEFIRKEKIVSIMDNNTKDMEEKHRKDLTNHILNIMLCKGNLYCSNIIISNGLSQKLNEFKINKDDRYDFSKLFTITIDDEKTDLIDDALSVTLLKNGNILAIVSIADVISKLTDNNVNRDSLGKLLNNRFETLYYSKVSCSLRPNQNKRALSHLFEIDSCGNIVDFRIVKSTINSDYRLDNEGVVRNLDSFENEELNTNIRLHQDVLKRLQFKSNNFYGFKDQNIGHSIVCCYAKYTNGTVADCFFKSGIPNLCKANPKVKLDNIIDSESIIDFDPDSFSKKLISLENSWELESVRYYAFDKAFRGYKEEYCRVTSPIIEDVSRINQAIEHSFLVNGDYSDMAFRMWNKYLDDWNKKKAKLIKIKKKKEFEAQQ